MRSRLLASVALLLLAGTAGCAVADGYPSLALRPEERRTFAEPAPPPAGTGTPAATADARYRPLVQAARDGDAAFRRTVSAAAETLRAGRRAPIGSDAWGDAQQQLTRVQAARGVVTQVLLDTQAAADSPEVREDSGLAAAAARALAIVAAIDAEEARTTIALAPERS